VTAPDIEPQAVRQHLERALASPNFARSERLSRFLRFVVERHLEGRDDELKESVIALEVFGDRDYDPKQDSIVRTEAGRLRARLAEYYQGPGIGEPVIFELPKGGYVPVFRQVAPAPVQSAPPPERVRSRRPWVLAAAAVCVVGLVGAGWWLAQRKSAPIAIAVLPLRNLNQDPSTDYFADGLTDELIRNLSIIDGLAVRSQTSSFAFKGKPRNLRDVGQQLQADYILEGSVLRSGQQLRIDAQLVRIRDDVTLWSGKYDKVLTDVFAIQGEISQGIVNGLRLKLGNGRRRYETSVEAYDYYLRARAVEIANLSPISATGRAVAAYQQAIAKDPAFEPAYAGLAMAYAFRSGTKTPDRDSELTMMRTAAEKAVQLDPLSSDAQSAIGVSSARDAAWAQSEKSFRRAIELDANNSMAYLYYASYLLMPLGRNDEALRELQLAEKADPLSPQVHGLLSFVLLSLGRNDDAAGHCEKASDHEGCLGRARVFQGRFDEAIPLLRASSLGTTKAYLGYALGRVGHRAEAEQLAASGGVFIEAATFCGLGDKDRAVEALGRLADFGPVRLGRTLGYPEFALVRDDGRVKAIRKKVGLP
jgi:TolB-like protein